MTEKPELKPCPFCGSDPKWGFDADPEIRLHFAHCSNLNCPVGPDVCGEEEANVVLAWNTRPALSPQPPLGFEHLRQWGFAPGSYSCFCSDCGKQHTADKRAWRCLSCAEAKSPQPPLSPQEGWKPIETAPKDVAILIYASGYSVSHFNTLNEKWWTLTDGTGTAGERSLNSWNTPTHWMPLPQPPAGGSDHV